MYQKGGLITQILPPSPPSRRSLVVRERVSADGSWKGMLGLREFVNIWVNVKLHAHILLQTKQSQLIESLLLKTERAKTTNPMLLFDSLW